LLRQPEILLPRVPIDSHRQDRHTVTELINQFRIIEQFMSIPKVITALTARTQFGQILRRAGRQQERFIVDRRGNPEVVIMGLKDFLKTIAPEPEVLKAIRAEAKRNKTSKLSSRQIDQEISAYRRERRLKTYNDYGN
jgi:prevent-host-death family protein